MKYLIIQPDGEMELRDAINGNKFPTMTSIEGSIDEIDSSSMVLGVDFNEIDGMIYTILKNRCDNEIYEVFRDQFA